MEWLLVLVCPLMMLFMMKGHGGHKHGNDHKQSTQNIEDKINKLEEENKKLYKQIQELSMVKKEL